jgi:hypothetical protein
VRRVPEPIAAAFALSHPNFQSAEEALKAAINHIHSAQNVNGPTFGGQIADEYHQGRRW